MKAHKLVGALIKGNKKEEIGVKKIAKNIGNARCQPPLLSLSKLLKNSDI